MFLPLNPGGGSDSIEMFFRFPKSAHLCIQRINNDFRRRLGGKIVPLTGILFHIVQLPGPVKITCILPLFFADHTTAIFRFTQESAFAKYLPARKRAGFLQDRQEARALARCRNRQISHFTYRRKQVYESHKALIDLSARESGWSSHDERNFS